MVLSDYGVEVKSVPTGIDVFAVTQSFSPDIILADILLNKKNGYEVSVELKSHDETKDIPIVLMWSSFMQLDPEKFNQCKADASLEKPFDTETVRSLVERLVPKLQTFPLKGLLNHPPMPDFEESDTFVRQKTDFNTLAATPKNTTKEPPARTQTGFVIDEASVSKKNQTAESDAPDSFSQVDLNPTHRAPENDEWSSAKTSQFVIETESFGDFEEVKVINSRSEDGPDLQKKINEQIQTYLKDSPVASHKASLQQRSVHSSFDEQLMREEIRQTAERICWQIIPEVTEKIVREELNKLLQGIEKNV